MISAGYNIIPANKQVMDGIKKVKTYQLHLHNESTNVIKEIRTYKWRQDKNKDIPRKKKESVANPTIPLRVDQVATVYGEWHDNSKKLHLQ